MTFGLFQTKVLLNQSLNVKILSKSTVNHWIALVSWVALLPCLRAL